MEKANGIEGLAPYSIANNPYFWTLEGNFEGTFSR
jgi:hypothetical protein